jgi:hypothetical protein
METPKLIEMASHSTRPLSDSLFDSICLLRVRTTSGFPWAECIMERKKGKWFNKRRPPARVSTLYTVQIL